MKYLDSCTYLILKAVERKKCLFEIYAAKKSICCTLIHCSLDIWQNTQHKFIAYLEVKSSFHSLVMHKVWELAKTCPQPALDWLSIQVARNRYVQSWLVSTMNNWVEQYLLAHPNHKVRSSAAFLVVSLVNSSPFRQAFR